MFGLNHLSDLFDQWANEAKSTALSNSSSFFPKPTPNGPEELTRKREITEPAPTLMQMPKPSERMDAGMAALGGAPDKTVPMGTIEDLYRRPLEQMKESEQRSQVTPERATRELSRQDYEKLSPQQRAAVDFNTLLTKAAAQDKAFTGKPTDEQRARYDKMYSDVLGGSKGVESYSPHVLALLEQVKYRDPHQSALAEVIAPGVADVGKTSIDDYVSLKQAISDADLAKYLGGKESGPLPAPDEERRQFVTKIAAGTDELAKSLARGNKMLQDFQTSAAADREALLGGLGLTEPVKPTTGFSTGKNAGELDQKFQQGYNVLAQIQDPEKFKKAAADLVSIFQQSNINPDDFFSYAATRSRNYDLYGGAEGESKVDTKTLAERLGLKVKGD